MPASPQDPAKFTYAFRLDETLKARYIRLAFSKQEAGWFFIDEISAYAYSADNAPEQGTVAQYYGDPTVPAAEPSYWPETDADYDETLNLALGAEHIYVQHFSELEPDVDDARKLLRSTIISAVNKIYLDCVFTDLRQEQALWPDILPDLA